MATTRTPRKKPAKRARKTTRKTTTAAKRGVTDAHKAAMAQGRKEGAAVGRYLDALDAANAAKQRGRKRSPEVLLVRLDDIETRLKDPSITRVNKVALAQTKIDLQKELAELNGGAVNPDDYADDFVKVVKGYSERKGLTKAAWRAIGVPAALLAKAGVK